MTDCSDSSYAYTRENLGCLLTVYKAGTSDARRVILTSGQNAAGTPPESLLDPVDLMTRLTDEDQGP